MNASREDTSLAVLKPDNTPLSFKTAPEAANPRVYYVAPDGNDDKSGLKPDLQFDGLYFRGQDF